MKRIIAMLLAALMLLGCGSALAATEARVIDNRIATRSGPGTKYTEPGSFLSYGDWVTVHTKAWDDSNGIYWLQVEFTSGGQRYRAYTGSRRIDASLNDIPDERILDYSWLNYNTYGYAGPGYDYHYYGNIMLYKDGNCRVMEVENNFALVDTSASTKGATRVWVPLNAVAGGSAFYGQDTYPDYDDGWDNSWDDGPTLIPDDDDGGATLIPGDPWQGGYVNPVGRYVTVWVDSGHARSGPGTNYDFLNYVHEGDVLQVLDWDMGNTGKDWYQVRINGRLCWISSGLVTLDGNSNGTAYGVPIVLEDPFADYPQTSTYLIGRWFRVNPSSAHVRKEPHTDTPTVGYVKENQCYEILDCRNGNTGKAWYKIEVEGEIGWISSGLTTLLGY